MKWPLVTRKTHEAEVARLTQAIEDARKEEFQKVKANVRAWARELNYNLFHTSSGAGAVRAALANPDAIVNFTPPVSDYAPIKPLPAHLQAHADNRGTGYYE